MMDTVASDKKRTTDSFTEARNFQRLSEKPDLSIRGWQDLGNGAPTIIALAWLCSRAMMDEPGAIEDVSLEGRAVLYAARDRGVLEVKGTNDAFEAPDRFLTVYVETASQHYVPLKSGDPRLAVALLDGFRQLCAAGFVMHHLFREFSLSRAGFAAARRLSRDEVAEVLDQLTPPDEGGW